jgi:hypothetical protein
LGSSRSGQLSERVLHAVDDPLPSWNEGTAKQSIVKFVTTWTNTSWVNLIPALERIAVFDTVSFKISPAIITFCYVS